MAKERERRTSSRGGGLGGREEEVKIPAGVIPSTGWDVLPPSAMKSESCPKPGGGGVWGGGGGTASSGRDSGSQLNS